YVNTGMLDATVNATQPEALVYEVDGNMLKLVAVEYSSRLTSGNQPPSRDFSARSSPASTRSVYGLCMPGSGGRTRLESSRTTTPASGCAPATERNRRRARSQIDRAPPAAPVTSSKPAGDLVSTAPLRADRETCSGPAGSCGEPSGDRTMSPCRPPETPASDLSEAATPL